MNEKKKDWVVEPIEVFFLDKKEQKRISNTSILTLNSSGQLDKAMEHIKIGGVVEIEYTGKKEMEGGKFAGKMAHGHIVTEMESDGDEESEEDEENEDEYDDEEFDEDEEDEEDL